jgi:hypothetical protein
MAYELAKYGHTVVVNYFPGSHESDDAQAASRQDPCEPPVKATPHSGSVIW